MKDFASDLLMACRRCYYTHALMDRPLRLEFDEDTPVIVGQPVACDCACHLNPVKKIARRVKP